MSYETDVETVKSYFTHPRNPNRARAKMAAAPEELAALSDLARAIRAWEAAPKDEDGFYAPGGESKGIELAEDNLRRAIRGGS